ncbi:MAG: cell division protein FtsX [Flavobacteriales bacterium]|jgi:cell division transport system permease protein|nr:cell division protein FtsX [Flavobacteriales bacterium]MBK9513814.1 cell division protein FtsX [Flavobacteriales bacterium]MBP7449831.1 permease-like cell division protein FtsX [Flavobacteriales bacterium]
MNNERYFKARTRSSNVSTIIGIALVLFMLGVLGFLVLNAQALERYFRENVRVEVFLKRDLKEVDLMQFRKELDNEPFTKETRYVTADEAAELLKKDLGEDFLGVLGSNPLLPSVELNLGPTYAVPDSLKWIVAHLKQDRRVEEVAYNAAVVENIDTNMGKLTLIVLGFTALLLIIAIALINNTIRLAIYSKRFLIRTMHLVGATQWFIKRPFLGQSLWQGILGALLAIGLLVGLLQLAQHYMPDLLAFTDALTLAILFAGVLVLGLLISLASTWFAVGRYLRMNSEDLHWS